MGGVQTQQKPALQQSLSFDRLQGKSSTDLLCLSAPEFLLKAGKLVRQRALIPHRALLAAEEAEMLVPAPLRGNALRKFPTGSVDAVGHLVFESKTETDSEVLHIS